MENIKNVKLPPMAGAGRLAQLLVAGGAAMYGLANSLFNVEGGHRAIVFNRIVGVKDTVGALTPPLNEPVRAACPRGS